MPSSENTSWSTAQLTGALALMDYVDVKRAVDVYQLQETFLRSQTRADDALIAAMPFFQSDPINAYDREVEAEKQALRESLTTLEIQRQLGVQLSRRYAVFLSQSW